MPCSSCFCLLNLRISLTISTILSGFSIYLSSSDISSISSFKSFNPLLIIFTNSLFWLVFTFYRDFNISLGLWKLKYVLNNFSFMSVSFSAMHLLNLSISVIVFSCSSSVSSSDSFSTWNPSRYGKTPFLNTLMISSLTTNSFLADFKVSSFSFIFARFFGLYLLFRLFINICNSCWLSCASCNVRS